MKENEIVYYKAHLRIDEKGELHGISVSNQQIPMGLFKALNDAMHEVLDRFNGKTTWKETYIRFTYNGKRYEQFDGNDIIDIIIPCTDCVFRGEKHCQHPYYHNGSKGYCKKPYREVKMED